ncbi:toll/interleukin-1 receptor domain-containing protein [Pseudomonas koreensis]|uniref:toll/interleukin-1 receptor domain-containing protein n=1 Tax=Pseudomonas koreensis TaxID=198620 RepID=UPI0021C97AFA|nr:toll/interleukin-1 receptor domain-containing protein [Pseudomonas koreensis]MCU0093711.1 toll/interleukin-1 receptor domain-containing protein [Pseudomonas koreensis]
MKVFISWSGETSRRVGDALRNWLPMLIQSITPYYTPSDIEKGTRWSSDIAGELDASMAGLFCVTRENLTSPWLMFEAGAISKKVDGSMVYPILIGIENSELKGPLNQFQVTLFNKPDIRRLVIALNNSLKEKAVDENVLSGLFERLWPELEAQVNEILEAMKRGANNQPTARTEREMLEEVLELSRALAIQKTGGFKLHNELNDLISNFLVSFHSVFHIDWDHSSACLSEYSYISPRGTFIEPQVEDEENNWANRALLLNTYRALIEFIETNKVDIDTSIYKARRRP